MRAHVAAAPTRRSRRALGAALATSALLVSACADEADTAGPEVDTETVDLGEFQATAAYLQQAADQSAAEGYRVELLLSLSGEVDDDTPALMAGEVDGDAFHYVMDIGTMLEQMGEVTGESMPSDLGIDLTMEMAGDSEAFYMRAPMFAELGGMAGSGPEADLAALGDGWGYVDMAELGDQLPGDLAEAMGGQGVDPQAVVAMIQEADEVEDLGTDEVRGAAVHGLSAEVTMGDLLAASGQDADALAELGSPSGDDTVAELYDTMTPVEVWIDDDGYLRRMAFGYDLADIAAATGEDTDDLGAIGLDDLSFAYAMDMYDYGTEIDFVAPDDAVDVTDAFADLAQG